MSSSGLPYSRGTSSPPSNQDEGQPESSNTKLSQQQQQQPIHPQYHQMQAIHPQQQHQSHPGLFYNPQMPSQALSMPYSPALSQFSNTSSPIHSGISRFPTMQNTSSTTPSGMPSSGSRMIRPSSGRASASSSGSSNKAPRARVNMACVHCRSRKIRCDGNQPSCATCSRLGRVCTYENITEEENAAVREKKRRSKDARQARLEAISQLGVPMPRHGGGGVAGNFSERRRPYSSSFSGGEIVDPYATGMAGSSVLRDTRISSNTMLSPSSRQPSTFTTNRQQQQQEMIPPPLPSPSYPSQQSPYSAPFSNRTWQSQVPTNVQYTGQSLQRTVDHVGASTRRRGATVGGFENEQQQYHSQQQQQQQGNTWRGQHQMITASGSIDSGMNLYQNPTSNFESYQSARGIPSSLDDVIAPPMTSLSQPATPHGTYQFHANMLSSDLTATAAGSSGSPTGQHSPQQSNSSPFFAQHQQYGRPKVDSSSSSADQNEGQQSHTTFYHPIPGMVTSISDDNIHAGSLYMGRSEPYSNATMVGSQQMPGIMSSTQQQATEEDVEKSETDKSIERTSNEKQFWKRTTNSDAAIARFFARVVAARDADSENAELPLCGPGGFNILAWSENTNLMANPQNDPSSAIPLASSSVWSGHEGGNVIGGGGMEPTIPASGVITPDSFTTAGDHIGTTGSTSARRTSELSLLSQQSPASMMPSATGVTTPSDSGGGQGGFRSHRPPPLRIESLPTFDQHQQMQQFNVIGGTGANVIQHQSGVRANSEGQIPSVLLTPMTLQQQQQERILIASPSVLTPNISPGAINSPSLTISPSAVTHDQQQQQQYFPSAARTTPITELSSHLLALGHSTQQESNEEDTGN